MPIFVSKLSPEQWAEVRHLRAGGATYVDLAARFGIRAAGIGQRARKEGWAWPGAGGARAAQSGQAKARDASPATADIRRLLALRLYRLIELEISMMELRMTRQLDAHQNCEDAGVPAAAPKQERDSFAALIESINQVTEMASEPAAAADGRSKSAINPELAALSADIEPDALAAASEKDALRTRLAEQIAKLVGPA